MVPVPLRVVLSPCDVRMRVVHASAAKHEHRIIISKHDIKLQQQQQPSQQEPVRKKKRVCTVLYTLFGSIANQICIHIRSIKMLQMLSLYRM